MADREKKRLSFRRPRAWTTVHGGGALVFGAPFVLVGGAVMLVGAGVIPVSVPKDVPLLMITSFGAMFFLAGAALCVHGCIGIARAARRRAILARFPERHWMADHPWSEEGTVDSPLRKALGLVWPFFMFSVFLVPFNYVVFFSSAPSPFFVKAVIGLFDLVPAWVALYGIYLFLRWAKYGAAFLEFHRFPFFVGEEVKVTFSTTKDIGRIRSVSFSLRCIQEEVEEYRAEGRREERVVAWQLYEDTRTFAGEGELHPHAEGVPLSFPLPGDVPGTSLSSTPPRYWELEVKADVPGVDFHASFLVPVYRERDEPE